jgi:hypothetical protein
VFAVVDLLPNRVDSARTEPKKPGFDAAFFRLDITKSAEVDAVARRIKDGLGLGGILSATPGSPRVMCLPKIRATNLGAAT